MAKKKSTAIPPEGAPSAVAATAVKPPLFRNSWAVVPVRVFLGALFIFAGYAKLTYPGFLDPQNETGFKATLVGVKDGSPIGGMLQPMIDHPVFFGYLTAYSEIAIGLGLVVGLLTRLAALGGITLTTMIALTVNWTSIKQYTGSYGWYTSVDIVAAVALTIFVIGGSGPASGDRLFWWLRARRRAAEPSDGYHQPSADEAMARLRGAEPDYPPMAPPMAAETSVLPVVPPSGEGAGERQTDDQPERSTDTPTGELRSFDRQADNQLAEEYPTQEHARIDEDDLIDEQDFPPSPHRV
jgi:thiosulfate dehydrogenase [quinone] large subunit